MDEVRISNFFTLASWAGKLAKVRVGGEKGKVGGLVVLKKCIFVGY